MPTIFISLFSIISLSACATPSATTSAVQLTQAPNAVAQNQPLPSPGSAVSLDASQKVEYPLTAEEKKPLLAKFKKTLADQEKNIDRDQRNATKEFTAAQSQELKDWRNNEKKARQAYFDQHLSGPDRRTYVQSYIARKKDFDQKQKNDLASFKLSLKEKHDIFKNNEKNRLAQFQSNLDNNVRPSTTLWNP